MKELDTPFLRQLVNSLAEAEAKLDDAKEKKSQGDFEEAKQLMLKINKKIIENL